MLTPEPHLDDLAAAVLDGTPVDWPSVQSSADADSRALMKELEVVAALASFHRDAPTVPVPPAWASSVLPAETLERWGHLRLLEQSAVDRLATFSAPGTRDSIERSH